MKKFQISLPQSIVLSVALLSFAAVYLFVDDAQRSQFNEWIGIAWAAVATVVGPLLRRRAEEVAEPVDKGINP